MKPYPAYKDSGVPWLGQVPEGWNIEKLKWLANVQLSNVDKKSKEGEAEVELCNYVDVYYNEVITNSIDFMQATASENQIERLSLERGDVLITKDSETPDDIAVPAYVSETLPGVVCGYHLALLRPKKDQCDGNYLYRSFLANGIKDQFEFSANGITRFGIGKYTIENALFLVPPLPEQTAIAAYLDRKTAQLDAVIAKKERLIELLREERTAIISQAVTKGLNPDVPMKDSGVPWLGQVPVGWEMKKMKYIANLKSGSAITANSISEDGDYPVFGGNGLRGYCSSYNHEGSFVLVGRQGALCGNINYATGKFWASEHAVVANLYQGIDLLWFGELLRSMNLNQFSQSAAQPGLAVEYIENLEIPIPLLDEQATIAANLDRKTAEIDQTIARTERQIDLLREYRTTLVSDVVTGKVDVRQEVAHDQPCQ